MASKTFKQAVTDFNKDPKSSVEVLREHVGNDPVLALLPSGKVDYDETVEFRSYFEEFGMAAPGAKRLSELLESARPAREFDVLRGVALFKGKAPARPGRDEPVVDWNPVQPIWRETVAYAVEHGKLPQGSDSETVAAKLSSVSPEVPWPRLRAEWEALVASTKPADAVKVARVRGRMAGGVATGAAPFVPAAAGDDFGGRVTVESSDPLFERLCGLLPAQFDEAVFRARIPAHYLPSLASQSARALVVVQWAQQGEANRETVEAAVRVVVHGPGGGPVRVHFVYAAEDAAAVDKFRGHLAMLEMMGKIEVTSSGDVRPGAISRDAHAQMERSAEIVIPFLSSDFLASLPLVTRVVDLARSGKRVIPVVLRPCSWQEVPVIGRYAVLPSEKGAVSQWPSADSAFVNVVGGLRNIVTRCRQP